jgi:hypothetical protein
MTTVVGVIQETVAAFFELTREQLLSKRRTRDVVWPRQVAMTIAVRLIQSTRYGSLPYIVKQFGNMDHTTVMHAVKMVERAELEGGRAGVGYIPVLQARCVTAIEKWRAKEIAKFATLAEPPWVRSRLQQHAPPPPPPPTDAPRPLLAAYWAALHEWKRSRIRYPTSMQEPAHV